MRRVAPLFLVLAALLAVAPAAHGAPDPGDRKAKVDQELRQARERLQRARAAERRVQQSVARDTREVRRLSLRLQELRGRLDTLQRQLAPARRRLGELRKQRDEAEVRLQALEESQARVRQVVTQRLVAMYRSGDPDPVAIMFSGEGVVQAFESLRELERIAEADRQLFADLADSERNVLAERSRTIAAARSVRAAAAELFDEEADVEVATERASRTYRALEDRRAQRRQKLTRLSGDRHAVEAEARDLERESAALAARILRQTVRADGVRVPRSAGPLLWPCAGPVTSTFGPRWGRMHEGLDIGCSYGQTIVAAAAGTIIYAGPQGGYGNIILIQHSPTLVTAYGHQSSFIRTSGRVAAGQPIGRVGSTGNSTGPHLHFETRVSGGAQDPMRFL